MPTILYSPASPYSAKVRMAAAQAGIACDAVVVDTNADPDLLLKNNPLGKIPVLVPDDGPAIYDSRAITQYLNRQSGSALFPRNPAKRTEAEPLETGTANTPPKKVCLFASLHYWIEEKIHQPWVDRQWSKAERALDHLVANTPKLPAKINAGHIALRATLGYMTLRFGGKWEKGRSKLTRWAKKFDEKFPELAELLPK